MNPDDIHVRDEWAARFVAAAYSRDVSLLEQADVDQALAERAVAVATTLMRVCYRTPLTESDEAPAAGGRGDFGSSSATMILPHGHPLP